MAAFGPPSGIEIWILAVLCMLLFGPFLIAGVIFLVMRGRRAQQTVPAGWLQDPTSRHELRYWDGGGWTDNVIDSGAQSIDKYRRGESDGPRPAI